MNDSNSGGAFLRRLDNVSRYLILAVIFLLPLATLPIGWLPLPIVKMGVLAFGVLAALIAWSVARLNERAAELPNTNVVRVALLLVAGYFLAAVLSGDVINSLIGFGFERDTVLGMFTFVGALSAVALTTRKVSHFIRLHQMVFASFLVIGVFQIVRLTFGADVILPGLFSTDPTATTLGSWNDLAVLSGLVLLLSLAGLALFSARKTVRGGLYVIVFISLFLLAVVNLSAVWATLAIITFLFAAYMFSDASYDQESGRFVPSVPWTRLLPSILVLVVSVVFLMGSNAIGERISSTFGVAFVDVRPSWEGTVAVGTGVYQQNALFGVGPNAFKEAWVDHKPLSVNETSFWNTDFAFGVGFVPSAFITGGIVVGLLWLLFFAAFARLGLQVFARRIVPPPLRYIVVSSYIGAAYLWVLSIIYVPQTVMLAYAFMFTGAAVAAAHAARIIRTHELRTERSYASGLALTSIVLVTVTVAFGTFLIHIERVVAGAMLSRAVVEANSGNLDRADYLADRASLFTGDIRSSQLKTNVGLVRLSETLGEQVKDKEAQQAKLQKVINQLLY